MIIKLLILSSFLLFGTPEVPNSFPSYLQARDAAEKSHKPMLIFISGPDCSTCEAAWNAYTKDAQAVEKHVSVRVDRQNFDGQVIAALYEAGHAPAWVLVDEKDNVMEKWSGGWKDANGKPTLYIEVPGEAHQPVAKSKSSKETSVSAKTNLVSNTSSDMPVNPVAAESKPQNEKTSATTTTSTLSTSGFVLQAGYFGSEANAQKCITELQAMGFDGFKTKSVIQNGTTFYRVISPTYITETEAQSSMDRMSVKGSKVTVKKISEL